MFGTLDKTIYIMKTEEERQDSLDASFLFWFCNIFILNTSIIVCMQQIPSEYSESIFKKDRPCDICIHTFYLCVYSASFINYLFVKSFYIII